MQLLFLCINCSYTKYSGPVCTLELMVKLCGLRRYSYLQCTIPSHHRNRSSLFFSCFYEQFFRRNGNVNVTFFFSFYIFFSGPAIGTSASLAVQI